MKYYKQVSDNYIILVGIDCGGIEITEEEYKRIMDCIDKKPEEVEGYVYMLNNNLVWELIEVVQDPDGEEDIV